MSKLSRPTHKNLSTRAVAISIIGVLSVMLVIYTVVNAMFVTIPINGSSMLNTIQDGDRVLLYKLGEYRRGDVIVFISPESQASTNSQKMYLIKRIIALPGDTIDIVYDQELDVYVTYVNEIQLDEPYLMTTKDWGSELPRTVVGSDMFFYMGDNRPESRDSRDGQLGSLDKSVILGRAVLRYNIGYSETTGTFDFDVGIINRVK